MPAFISVGFIFGCTGCVCITDVRTFFLQSSYGGLLACREKRWNPHLLHHPAEKLKYLICRSKNGIWETYSWIPLKHTFHLEPAGLWRRERVSVEVRRQGSVLRHSENRPNGPLCSLLVLWLLICRVSCHHLSFAFDMLIYIRRCYTTPQLFFLVVRLLTFPAESQLENIVCSGGLCGL